ncbi:hypothetical protein [Parasitella parasitica]|uniref:Uncharacterized protein n=1 Tax=Parasitella parasitica TaxID=35722 RepID=A0A0B7NSD4_9FUNG|nr:hypothetical protein [Parasitella parasitica]
MACQHLKDNWKNSLKIVNNVSGFEPFRPHGSLVEMVEPIMSKSYPDLTQEHKQFLDTHDKVAYTGVRTALYPFYGDQVSNAYMMRSQRLGVQSRNPSHRSRR